MALIVAESQTGGRYPLGHLAHGLRARRRAAKDPGGRQGPDGRDGRAVWGDKGRRDEGLRVSVRPISAVVADEAAALGFGLGPGVYGTYAALIMPPVDLEVDWRI